VITPEQYQQSFAYLPHYNFLYYINYIAQGSVGQFFDYATILNFSHKDLSRPIYIDPFQENSDFAPRVYQIAVEQPRLAAAQAPEPIQQDPRFEILKNGVQQFLLEIIGREDFYDIDDKILNELVRQHLRADDPVNSLREQMISEYSKYYRQKHLVSRFVNKNNISSFAQILNKHFPEGLLNSSSAISKKSAAQLPSASSRQSAFGIPRKNPISFGARGGTNLVKIKRTRKKNGRKGAKSIRRIRRAKTSKR
jgi:hypothetical protein